MCKYTIFSRMAQRFFSKKKEKPQKSPEKVCGNTKKSPEKMY